jgi:hypothetical protein
MSLDIDMIISDMVVPAALMPIKSFICDVTMSMATADVNPELTGPEMKSIKKPAMSNGNQTNAFQRIILTHTSPCTHLVPQRP